MKAQFMKLYDYLFRNSPGANFRIEFDAVKETNLLIDAKFTKVKSAKWYQCQYLQVYDYTVSSAGAATTYYSPEFKTAKELREWTTETLTEIFKEA